MANSAKISVPIEEWDRISDILQFFRDDARLVDVGGDIIVAETGPCLRSWGECISAKKLDDKIIIESRCKAQIVDWGINKGNLDKIEELLGDKRTSNDLSLSPQSCQKYPCKVINEEIQNTCKLCGDH